MKLSPTNIGFIVAGVVVLGGLYWWFFANGTSNTDAPLSAAGQTTPLETQFVELTGELNPISFNTAIFSDPRFMVLADLRTPVTPESVGRADPFASFSK